MNTDENQGTTDDSLRDGPTWHGDRFPAWDSDESALRAARTEARESLEETIKSIRRIDESAMRTLRLDLVIIGLTLTVASSFQLTSRLVNGLTILGFVAVSLSALVAVVTTLGPDYPTGVSEDYLQDFQQGSWSEREWNEWMLCEYSQWLSDANQMVNGEARVLFYAKTLLGAGMVLLIVGIVLGTVGFTDLMTGFKIPTGS